MGGAQVGAQARSAAGGGDRRVVVACTEPVCEQFRDDAALNADYYGGILRSYYDGKQRWLDTVASENGKPYRRGDLWASVGAWFSGRWWNPAARGYVRAVKRRLKARTWRTRDFRAG